MISTVKEIQVTPPDRDNAFQDREITIVNQPGALWFVLDDLPQDHLLSWISLEGMMAIANINITNTIARILFPTLRNPLGAWVENHIQYEHKTSKTCPIMQTHTHQRESITRY